MKPAPSGTRAIETIRVAEPVAYETMHGRQLARRNAIERGDAGNALFLLEHAPVFTLGRDTKPGHVLLNEAQLGEAGIALCDTDRGGDVTYHGPGQLVAYPVLDLTRWRQSISWYLRSLEEVLIRQLGEYGLKGERLDGFTGVWIGDAKVAAIGVGIHNWVTFHGIALNVDPDMSHFSYIVPCGIGDKPVTSLAILMDEPPTMAQAMDDFARHFRDVFLNG